MAGHKAVGDTQMTKHTSMRSAKQGLPPGTPLLVGEQKTRQVRITAIEYGPDDVEEKTVSDLAECAPPRDGRAVTWINVDGLHDMEIIQRLGDMFGLHPLMLEDIVSTRQRPKVEDYGDRLYVVLRMFSNHVDGEGLESEQVSIVLGEGIVLSFQERQGDVFDPVRERIRTGKGRIRDMGPDYLLYSLIDAVVDSYFLMCEQMGDQLEELEDELVTDPKPEDSARIHHLKRELIVQRKSIWPLREVIASLMRRDSPLILEATGLFLRDVYDHTIQVMDTIESSRDVLSGLLDIYLTGISNRMNEVMKVLTIIATIFIPLTFIAGIYGMNFDNMPELHWRWSYPTVMALMAGICVAMVVYFRKKRWL
jgi:magnesium transporter